MTAEVMMKEYKNMKKELTVTEFQLRQFQGVSEQDMIDSMLEVPEGISSVEEVNGIMAVCPDWCEGLPLKAAGFESPFYKKD